MAYQKMVVDGRDTVAFNTRIGHIPNYLSRFDGLGGVEFKNATKEEFLKLKRPPRKAKPNTEQNQILLPSFKTEY